MSSDTNTPTIQRYEFLPPAPRVRSENGSYVLYTAVEKLLTDHATALAAKDAECGELRRHLDEIMATGCSNICEWCDASLHPPEGAHETLPACPACYRAKSSALAAAQAENAELRRRLLSAAGDDLCRLTQEEIKAMSAGGVKIPPKEEFLASCERFHAQVAGEAGVLSNCLTLAQLIAENAELCRELERLKNAMATEANEIEQLIGKATGAPEIHIDESGSVVASDAPGAIPTGDVCTGDHVTITLVMLAVEEIKKLRRELEMAKASLERSRASVHELVGSSGILTAEVDRLADLIALARAGEANVKGSE